MCVRVYLDVAVCDAFIVEIVKTLEDLADNAYSLVLIELAACRNDFEQRTVWIVWDDKEVVRLSGEELDEPDDVGVVDPLHDFDLSVKVLEVTLVGDGKGNRLYGICFVEDRAAERGFLNKDALCLDNNAELSFSNAVTDFVGSLAAFESPTFSYGEHLLG